MKRLIFCFLGLIGYLLATIASLHAQGHHESLKHRHRSYAQERKPIPVTEQSRFGTGERQ